VTEDEHIEMHHRFSGEDREFLKEQWLLARHYADFTLDELAKQIEAIELLAPGALISIQGKGKVFRRVIYNDKVKGHIHLEDPKKPLEITMFRYSKMQMTNWKLLFNDFQCEPPLEELYFSEGIYTRVFDWDKVPVFAGKCERDHYNAPWIVTFWGEERGFFDWPLDMFRCNYRLQEVVMREP
jgi:hypothetical protein